MKETTYFLIVTCEDKEPKGIYRDLRVLHKDIRRYNKRCGFPFIRFKDMELYTGEDDENPVYAILPIRDELFWKPNQKG